MNSGYVMCGISLSTSFGGDFLVYELYDIP